MDDLPKGWAMTSVGEVATYQNGRAFKPSEWGAKGLPIIRIQNLNGTSSDYNFSDKCHEQKFKVRNGDLLFAWSASLGAFIWQGQEAWLNQHIFRVDHTEMISRMFLYCALTNITADLYAKAHGSGMVHVTKGKFERTPLRLPPLNEQHRIVAKIEELFSELDKGVESLKKARKQLKVYRQAVLKHAFEGKLTAQWREENKDKLEKPEQLLARIKREREARYEQQLKEWKTAVKEWESKGKSGKKLSKPKKTNEPKMLTSDDLPTLPEGWAWFQYGGLCSLIRNGISKKPEGNSGKKIFRISAVRPMEFDLSDVRFISGDSSQFAGYHLQQGDLIFTRYNGSRAYVGVCAEYKSDGTHLYPDKLIRTQLGTSQTISGYLEKAVNCGESRNFIESRIRTTAGQSGISGSDIKDMPVPLCSPSEQLVVQGLLDEELARVSRLLTDTEKILGRAEILRQSILQKAFAGQLVAQDPHDESASILLARISAAKNAEKPRAGA